MVCTVVERGFPPAVIKKKGMIEEPEKRDKINVTRGGAPKLAGERKRKGVSHHKKEPKTLW